VRTSQHLDIKICKYEMIQACIYEDADMKGRKYEKMQIS